jgi:hypothetical protein
MAKYIYTLRRGRKTTDPATGKVISDWEKYEEDPNHVKPLEGELVVEYDNGIPRLKVGDGKRKFSELPYIGIESFILPKTGTVTLYANRWKQDDGADTRWYQQVTILGATITANSKVDLQIKPEDLTEFREKDLAFVAENDGGTVYVYCIGQTPTKDYTLNTTVTEVVIDE